MHVDETILAAIARANPGDFAIYRIREGKLILFAGSPSLPALSGMTEEEYTALTAPDAARIVLEKDRPHVTQMVEQILSDGKDIDFTYRILHKTKGAVWIHAKSRLLGDLDGDAILMTSFLSTSFESEEHAQLLNYANAVTYVVEKKTYELLYANEPALRQWGRENLNGQPCYAFIGRQEAPCPWCTIPLLEKGSLHQKACYSPGDDKWFRIDCQEINWYGREAVAVCAVDITDEKRRQDHLELDKNSLETVINNIPVGVGVCEVKDGRICASSANHQITRMLGVSEDHFYRPNQKLRDRTHPEDRPVVTDSLTCIAYAGEDIRFEFRFRNEDDGEYRWYRTTARNLSRDESRMVFVCVWDITEEKEAQIEIQKSRQLYEAVVEEAHLAIWEYDMAAHRVTMADNPHTEADYHTVGMPRVLDNAPQSMAEYLEPKSMPPLLEMYRAIEGGAPRASCDVWFKRRPGQDPRCEHLCGLSTLDEKGKPVRSYGFGQNVTSQRLEEEKYARAYRQLADAHPYTLGSFHLNLTKNQCTSGRSPLSFVLKQQESGTADGYFLEFSKLIADPEVKETFFRLFDRQRLLKEFAKGHTQVSIEYPIIYPDGQLYWREGDLFMIRNPKTGDVEAVTYALDINERKKNEEIIKHLTSKKFDLIALIDLPRQTIEFRNKRPDITFGKIQERAGYEDWRAYIRGNFVPEEGRKRYMAGTELKTIARELSQNEEYLFTFPLREGDRLTQRQMQYSWLDREHGVVLAVRADITATYAQEQRQLALVKEALQRAEGANRAKTEFLSRISHDIRTPISIIQSMTGFAQEDLDDPKKLQDDLRKIETSNTFLLSLINDVLDISKIDSGKIELRPEPYRYDDYIANICNMFEPLCQQKKIRFVLETGQGHGTLLADHIRLNQITLNLLSNAVKYTPEGGTVTFSAATKKQADGKLFCEIRVRDTGIGMSPAFQKQMFEPFSQEYDNPNRPKAGTGTGLGLSIVKRLVDLVGGTISVKSAPGEGTDIRVCFAAPEASAAQSQAAESTGTYREKTPLAGKILLAEDNEINTYIAVRLLTAFGLEVETAENGRRAVALFSASKPWEYNAVLMDIQMPLLNGYEATSQIRALPRADAAAVPIIAMTADAFSAAQEESRRVGMDDYITKPLAPEVLRNVLEKAIRTKHGAPQSAPL